ncbi:MAG: hypothetical protein IJ561_00970 [Ruminococcus sp.]|nr:hypothetical protein [Ruminococcus sp.]
MDNIKVRKAPLLDKTPFTVNLFFDGKPVIPPAEEIIKAVKEIVGDVTVRSSNESFSSFVCVGRDYEIEHNGTKHTQHPDFKIFTKTVPSNDGKLKLNAAVITTFGCKDYAMLSGLFLSIVKLMHVLFPGYTMMGFPNSGAR